MLNLERKYQKSLSSLDFIDLFAGIGGFHLALSSFGANCVFSSEWDSHAQDVYEKNFGIRPKGDITKVSEIEIPSHDILCAGFPCQAFSISGKQNGFNDTRGTLFIEITRIVEYHNPSLLILENVANFEKHDNGRTLSVVLNSLKELNYNVFYKVLNASYFGVPQARERIYFVGFKKNLKVYDFEFPESDGELCTLGEVLIPDNELDKKIYLTREDIKIKNSNIKEGNNLFNKKTLKPIRVGSVNKGGQGERIYDINGHAITLSAYGGGIGAKTGLYLVNEKVRKLLPRECARIQGFPEDFIISESMSQAYKQFGNSVAINVLQSIIKRIIDLKCLKKIEELELVH
ncbi:MAG: DNA (cytosine-5-)-methyltransferase [Leptospiraceae bacterium]|nr:DNA (cytosine-5-)-methyltransferase [Leptospiraceae bacterium]